LNEKFEIDLVVYIKDTQHNSLTEIEHAVVCSEFLNSSFTNKIKDQILEIINKQIKNEDNSSLIENICLVDQITHNTKDNSNDDVFIQPSQVFSKYLT
jgi:ribosomal protein S3AE